MLGTDLKTGKSIVFPALFVNPQHSTEARLLREANERYPIRTGLGIKHIDGVVVSLKDWADVKAGLLLSQRVIDENLPRRGYPLRDRVLIIDPSLFVLFQGTRTDKERLFETELFPDKLRGAISQVSIGQKPIDKIDRAMEIVYPQLDSRLILNLLRFQIQNGTDVIVCPSVPLTSQRRFEKQLEKAREMQSTSRILLDTVLREESKRIDVMNLLTLNLSVIGVERSEEIIHALLADHPDQVGIRLMNLDATNTSQVSRFLEFLSELRGYAKSVPIHLLNLNEFGYVTFCYGANTATSPIATNPYFQRGEEFDQPPRLGSYYHPIDMSYDTYEVLLAKTRKFEYVLPCHCEICSSFENIPRVPNPDWNSFRRIHFLLVKSMEVKEIRDNDSSLKHALRDKFGRSRQTVWVPYLD